MTSTRERLIESTAELFRLHGYAGTGVKQIVERASAPFGSMYHHFPNGKEELGAATIRWSGAVFGELVELFYANGADPVQATADFFTGAADMVRDTDFVDACPIATVALEVSSTSEVLRLACAEVFDSWLAALDRHLVAAGLTRQQAHDLSTTLFCLLEGAFILARATRDERPVRRAGRVGVEVVRSTFERRAAQVAARR